MIELKNVSLEYPIMGLKSHSLQIAIYDTIGGILNLKKNKNTSFVRALNNINLTINNGDRLGIIGHNGAGKTTLLRLLSGVYPPTEGYVEV